MVVRQRLRNLFERVEVESQVTGKQYTIRIFLWLVAVQLVLLYVDIYNGMPILDDDAKYVVHVLSRYLIPVAIGVGIFLHIIEYAGAIIARRK